MLSFTEKELTVQEKSFCFDFSTTVTQGGLLTQSFPLDETHLDAVRGLM